MPISSSELVRRLKFLRTRLGPAVIRDIPPQDRGTLETTSKPASGRSLDLAVRSACGHRQRGPHVYR